jgi:DNA-binding response OmpR family regulator
VVLRQAEPEVKRRILVVEDDEGVAEVIARTLEKSGFDVTVADRGLQGLELARAGGFALVVLDLLLPDMDGVTVLDRLLSSQGSPQVLVVSALSNVEAKVRCLDLGASDYLAKPFALDELLARVRARTRDRTKDRTDIAPGDGSLTLDVDRRLALSDGRAIPLSTREFFLLEYLMRNQGRVCARKDLLEYVWGYTFDPGTNVVDVYVRRLRVKLGNDPIRTVRNVGYCFVGA